MVYDKREEDGRDASSFADIVVVRDRVLLHLTVMWPQQTAHDVNTRCLVTPLMASVGLLNKTLLQPRPYTHMLHLTGNTQQKKRQK